MANQTDGTDSWDVVQSGLIPSQDLWTPSLAQGGGGIMVSAAQSPEPFLLALELLDIETTTIATIGKE